MVQTVPFCGVGLFEHCQSAVLRVHYQTRDENASVLQAVKRKYITLMAEYEWLIITQKERL